MDTANQQQTTHSWPITLFPTINICNNAAFLEDWETFLVAACFSAQRAKELAQKFFGERIRINDMVQLYGRDDCVQQNFITDMRRLGVTTIGEEVCPLLFYVIILPV
jgi:hypothetical protein